MPNKYDKILGEYRENDETSNLTNYSFIPTNTVEVLTGCTEVAGKRYASVANALVYIATQTPSSSNIWSISSLDKTNSENFTLPSYVALISPKGFEGVVETNFSGNITLSEYSICNSVNLSGQITTGSTNPALPAILYGSYLVGTLIIGAGTYFQPVYSLMQPSADVELDGQMTLIGGDWLSGNINVNAGGVLVGHIDKFGGAIVDNGGTIALNAYGQFYDNRASGLSATTVGAAIDEVQGNIPTVPASTDDLPEGSTNLYFNGKTTDDLTEGSTNKYDETVALTAGTNIAISGTYPSFTIATTGINDLWQTGTSGYAELKTADDIYLKAKYKFFYN